ncbi:MAG: glycosyltransferase family 39 protein [Anaerolineales bacterium]|nr:glycosyltransferase family 39 protein [Anaerolineales bacterium]
MVRKVYLWLILILVLAIGLRGVAMVLVGESHVPWDIEFEEIANNLVENGQYRFSLYQLTPSLPTSFIPPVYPLLLAFTRIVAGENSLILLQSIQILAACLIILFLYGMVKTLGGNQRQGLLAAFFGAVYPPYISYAVDISTTTLETLFVILGLWMAIRAVKNHSLLSAITCGASLALATLTRPTWLSLLPLIPLWWFVYLWKKWGFWFKTSLAMGLAAIVVLSPWIYYNYITHGVFMATSTNGGLNFWIGNNSNANGEYIFPTNLDKDLVESTLTMSEVERDRFFYRQGWQFIMDQPDRFFRLAGRKLLYFILYRPNIGSSVQAAGYQLFDLVKLGFILTWLGMLPFAALGLFSGGAKWREYSLLILIFIVQALITMLYFSGTRFRTPIDGLVIIWVVFGLSTFLPFLKNRKHPAA